MDDIPLPFQTDQHHLNILVQDSPMLSPNPPPSVVEPNGQNLPPPMLSLTSNATLASGLSSSAAHQNSNNISNTSNFNNASSTTPSNNVIINNIKTNTTTIGTTNPESGVVHPSEASTTTAGVNADAKTKEEDNCLRNRWHTCPELHKAMDGVTYIADHTKKEEESTRVSFLGE
jgi:nicotinic acetylcholine receptor